MNPYKTTLETYNELAQQYQDKFMGFDHYNETFDLFCGLVAKEHAHILEIACGPGNITKYLLNKRPDFKIFGIDGAPKMIELAKENNPSATFEVMDCRNIDTIDKKFDAIICGFGLPYLSKEDVEKLFADARGLLNPKGIFYMSTMEGEYSNSGYKGSSNHAREIYIYYHNEKFLIDSLNKNDFKISDIWRKDYPENDGSITVDLFIIAKN